MKKKVYYSFQKPADAASVIDKLKQSGYSSKDMILLAKQPEHYQIDDMTVSGRIGMFADIATAMIGVGALGGLFEWFMETHVFHAMEFGPATIFPLIGILIGIAAGSFLGALIGAYIYLGRPEANCKKMLEAGRLVLVVNEKENDQLREKIGREFYELALNK